MDERGDETAVTQRYSPDGRWIWDGQRWTPAQPVLSIGAPYDRIRLLPALSLASSLLSAAAAGAVWILSAIFWGQPRASIAFLFAMTAAGAGVGAITMGLLADRKVALSIALSVAGSVIAAVGLITVAAFVVALFVNGT